MNNNIKNRDVVEAIEASALKRNVSINDISATVLENEAQSIVNEFNNLQRHTGHSR